MLFRLMLWILIFSMGTSYVNANEGWDLSEEKILENLKELESVGLDIGKEGLQYWFLGAKLGYYDLLTFLIPYIDVNIINKENQSALQIAAKNGQVKIAKLLLENGTPVDQQFNHTIITPLALAASQGYLDFIPLILTHGGNINNNRSAMHLAARYGHSNMLKALLEAGFDVNAKAEKTPLHDAVIQNHPDAVKILIDNKADLEAEYNGLTPLELAAKRGYSAIVDILLEQGAKIDNIHKAAFKGNMYILNRAISLGSDSLKISKNDMNALHFAACAGQKNIVKILIDNGISIKGIYDNAVTPLHLAARNGHLETVQMLLQAGANPKAKYDSLYNRNITPLFLAAGMGHNEIIDLLLNAGVAIDETTYYTDFLNESDRNSLWITPLHNAIYYGHLETVIKLIDRQARIRSYCSQWWSPLHEAAECGHAEIVQFLLEKKSEINLKENSYNRTPLHLAAKNGHLLTVEKLVLAGADINLRDKNDKTPARLAAENGHFDVVEYLKDK